MNFADSLKKIRNRENKKGYTVNNRLMEKRVSQEEKNQFNASEFERKIIITTTHSDFDTKKIIFCVTFVATIILCFVVEIMDVCCSEFLALH